MSRNTFLALQKFQRSCRFYFLIWTRNFVCNCDFSGLVNKKQQKDLQIDQVLPVLPSLPKHPRSILKWSPVNLRLKNVKTLVTVRTRPWCIAARGNTLRWRPFHGLFKDDADSARAACAGQRSVSPDCAKHTVFRVWMCLPTMSNTSLYTVLVVFTP